MSSGNTGARAGTGSVWARIRRQGSLRRRGAGGRQHTRVIAVLELMPAGPDHKLRFHDSGCSCGDDVPLLVVAENRPRRAVREQFREFGRAVHRIETDDDRRELPGRNRRDQELRRVLEDDSDAVAAARRRSPPAIRPSGRSSGRCRHRLASRRNRRRRGLRAGAAQKRSSAVLFSAFGAIAPGG